jgi:predicted nucleic acid-binding Zn ribbon protein
METPAQREGGAGGRRARRRRALSRGQWAVFRERFQIEETVQPPALIDAPPLAEPVGRLLRRLGMDDVLTREKLDSAWPAVVGAAVARHARPGPLQDGRLTVYVDSPVWLSELSRQHQKRIRGNLEREGIPVRELLFRIDPGERQ